MKELELTPRHWMRQILYQPIDDPMIILDHGLAYGCALLLGRIDDQNRFWRRSGFGSCFVWVHRSEESVDAVHG